MKRLAALREGGRRPLVIVYGAMADKDVDSISQLLPVDALYFLAAPRTPRAMDTAALALKLKHLHCTSAPGVEDAVRLALQAASAMKDPIVYIGGSTYVASEAISYIESI